MKDPWPSIACPAATGYAAVSQALATKGDCHTMYSLYSIRKGPAAIPDLARAMRNNAGNVEPGDV